MPTKFSRTNKNWLRKTHRGKPSISYHGKRTRRMGKKPLALKQHNFVERVPPKLINLNNSTLDANGNLINTLPFTFQMNNIPQIASYVELFEYYRIDKVVIDFRYKTSGLYANTDPAAGKSIQEINPTIIFKVDHNDATADSVVTLMESMRTKEKQLTNSSPNFSIQIKPAILTELYKTALASAYAPKWKTFLSMTDTNVPHYGLKVNIQCPAASGLADYGTLMIQQKIYFTAKNNE